MIKKAFYALSFGSGNNKVVVHVSLLFLLFLDDDGHRVGLDEPAGEHLIDLLPVARDLISIFQRASQTETMVGRHHLAIEDLLAHPHHLAPPPHPEQVPGPGSAVRRVEVHDVVVLGGHGDSFSAGVVAVWAGRSSGFTIFLAKNS